MIHEHFMVLEIPKEETENIYRYSDEAPQFADFDAAFDYLNRLVAIEGQQVFKQPRSPRPIAVALSDRTIELWCIKRTDDLLTD
jgi:hypothetical protein